MLCLVSPWMVFVALPVYVHFWGWKCPARLGRSGLLLSEVLLVGFRKFPLHLHVSIISTSAVVALIAYVLVFCYLQSSHRNLSLKFLWPRGGRVFL
jgi:hypothetical protein